MKKVILVIDDDKANLLVAQKLLADTYRVAAVNSGELAFHYLEKNIPDMILLDIQMPEMDGFAVMKQLQENEDYRRIPVIFLTADRSEQTEEACFEMGAVDFIGKPFVPAIMRQRVKRTLELEDYRKNLEYMVEKQLERITQLQQDIIISMANLIESRDGTTGEHVKRTSIYVDLILTELQKRGYEQQLLTYSYINYMRRAAPLHDIGKIMVSDMILQKPGSLTNEEYEIMKQHTIEGGKLILKNMDSIAEPEFVQIAADMATYHHEKWNGEGYPEGRKAEEIPFCARVLAVADVFDALVSKRQYKDEMSLEDAFSIMKEERGKYFDPEILDLFLQAKPQLKQIMAELK